MTVLLVDTGPLVAAYDSSASRHQECAAALRDAASKLVTCESVISEACFLLRRIGIPAAQFDLLHDVSTAVYHLPFRLEARAVAVRALMKKYADTPMSLADACLVDVATQLGTGRILTLDADFQVYRWGRNKPFELTLPV